MKKYNIQIPDRRKQMMKEKIKLGLHKTSLNMSF